MGSPEVNRDAWREAVVTCSLVGGALVIIVATILGVDWFAAMILGVIAVLAVNLLMPKLTAKFFRSAMKSIEEQPKEAFDKAVWQIAVMACNVVVGSSVAIALLALGYGAAPALVVSVLSIYVASLFIRRPATPVYQFLMRRRKQDGAT